MSQLSLVHPGSDVALQLAGLADEDGAAVSGATVTVQSVVDAAGQDVAGLSLPLTMAAVSGSPGTYRAVLPSTVSWTVGVMYQATVRAVDTAGTGEWTEYLYAAERAA